MKNSTIGLPSRYSSSEDGPADGSLDLDDLLDAHLNVSWLRPENVVWDTMASYLARRAGFSPPTLDLGAGNGITSFVTAEGRFGIDFDWYINVDVEGQPRNPDIHDTPCKEEGSSFVTQRPSYQIDVAADVKRTLLQQAMGLGLYKQIVQCDANLPLPFQDGSFSTIFSNILYWLDDPARSLRECFRVLSSHGRALLCIPDPRFYEFCESYRWRKHHSEWLRLLNAGRDACIRWTSTIGQFERLASEAGFQRVHSQSYLQQRTLALWDTGLRFLVKPLIRMVHHLTPDRRALVKRDWIKTIRPLFRALLEEELRSADRGGFHFFVLEKG